MVNAEVFPTRRIVLLLYNKLSYESSVSRLDTQDVCAGIRNLAGDRGRERLIDDHAAGRGIHYNSLRGRNRGLQLIDRQRCSVNSCTEISRTSWFIRILIRIVQRIIAGELSHFNHLS